MKKMFISVIALAMGVMAMATETAYVQIKLTGETGGANSVFLTEDDAYTNAYESGADVEKMMSQSNSKSVLMYGFVGSTPCEDVVAANLDGLVLGFTTNQVDQNYTLHFIDYEGSKALTLYDRVTKTPTVITDGGSYNFSVEAAQVGRVAINDRFVINYVAPAYVIMKGDFANPGGDWDYSTGNFTDNGTTFTKELDLAANTWYHFQLEEGYSPAIIAADGSSFDRDNNSHNLPVDGWHSALLLHADVAGTYTFTWNDVSDNLTITFPAPAHSVTTNSYGFCSFASSEDVEFLGGLKAYKGDFNPATYELTLTEVGTKVPANTGVILWNSAETAETFYYNVGVDATAADVTGNDFVGAVAATPVSGISADAIYCLRGNELMKYVGTDDIPAGKAYLPVTVGGSNPAPKHITMRFSETQAINNVEAEVKAEKFVQDGEIFIRRGNEVFNLQGQKVNF